jgi:peptidoglycan/LPS O-acetylase OafA/YrhL
VDVFFFVSGLLVTKSFIGKGVVAFAWARFTRIFPGLWLSILLLVAAAGLFFSPLPAMEFWLRPETLSYLSHNMTMLPGFGAQTSLPYALSSPNPLFNTPLWTLPHELQMYMLLALIGVLGGLRYPVVVGLVMVTGIAAAFADKVLGLELIALDRARFLYFFFAGSFAYLVRERVVVSTRGALVCLALIVISLLATKSFMVRQAVLLLSVPYLVLWFAYIPRGAVRQFNKVGDYSYGVYIYAFPIQMVLIGTAVGSGSIANFLLSMVIVLPIAAASWHLLESRALRIPLPALFSRRVPASQGAAE